MAFNPESIALTKSFFLKGVLLVYMVAFTSLYVQVQSLFGDEGIAPLRDFIPKSVTTTPKGPIGFYNIISLAPKIGLSYGTFVELLCLLGVMIAFSSLVVRRLSTAFSFGLLWYTYFSICQVGQGFMAFHSDLLLLEVGFFATLLAPLLPSSKMSNSDHDHLAFFLIRWLTFRYFVTNVLNVYLDNDNAWYNMTAIPMVAQGVQFPSLFSWHVFNLPSDWLKLFQGYEHALKLCAPFLCIFDLKYSRQLAFYTLLHLAIPSALFFNFGWTDLLISVCLVVYFKDAHFYNDRRTKQSTLRTLFDIALILAYVAVVGFILIRFYGFKYNKGLFEAKIMFTPSQFKLLADHLVPASLVLGTVGLLSSLHTTFFASGRKTSIIKTLIYTAIMVPVFFSTFPTLVRFSPGLEARYKNFAYTRELGSVAAPYMLSNNYLVLSKVSQYYGEGRPEVQIQARASADDPMWHQYDLRYKPGQQSQELSRVVPHLPRIDLKFWYAARSSLQSNQWIQTFAYRLATKQRDALNAIAPSKEFTKASQIRIALMNYKYSSKNKLPFAGYWSQSKFVAEYMPTTSIENLKFAVKSSGISLAPPTKDSAHPKQSSLDQLLSKYLEISSEFVRGIDHTAVIWTSLAVAAVSIFGKRS